MSANPSGATTIGGAANRLSQLLQSEPEPPTDSEQAEAQEVPETSSDEATEDLEAAPETPEGDTESEVEKYKVKVDGEELEVTLDDLRKGYMMEANYRNKTTALAKEKERLEAREAKLDADLNDARALLDLEVSNLETEEMRELKEDDPESYLREFEKVQKKVDKFNKLKEQREAELREKREKLVAKERDALFMEFPEWSDDEVRSREGAKLLNVLADMGFTRAELDNMTDHRMFLLAKSQAKLNEIQSKTLKDKEKRTVPKTSKPGTPKTPEERVTAETKALRQQLKKTGSMRDAARLLRS